MATATVALLPGGMGATKPVGRVGGSNATEHDDRAGPGLDFGF
jgi:hypothetical protein